MRRFVLLLVVVLAALPACAGGGEQARAASRPASGVPVSQRVDVNRATLEELMTVPGMKATWARRIIKYRPYRTKAALQDLGIVPPEVYARIKGYLVAHRDSDAAR